MRKLYLLLASLCMTAVASAQVTFTATGGTAGIGTNEGVASLFDNVESKWCAIASGAWFSFEASEAVVLTGYAMRTGSDGTTDNLNRNPKSWTIYGSNDNSNWSQIQQVTDNTKMTGEMQKTFYFDIDIDRASYKYYKFTVEAVQGGSIVQLSEFIPSYEYPTSKSLVAYAGGQWWSSQPFSFVTDGSSISTWISGDDRNYICMESNEAVIMKSYSITTGHDTQSQTARNPVSWTIFGSNTRETGKGGSSWEQIVKIEDSESLENVNSKSFYFDCESNTKSYKYYLLVIDKVRGGELVAGNYSIMCQISGFAINPHHDNHINSYSYSLNGAINQQVNLCDICGKVMYSGTHKGIVLSDGKPLTIVGGGWGSGATFTYTRTVGSNMGTIMLPYRMSAGSKTDATYYTLGCYDEKNDVLAFDEVTGDLNSFTPAIYILTDENGTTLNLDASNTGFSITPTANVAKADRANDGWEMVGTVKNGTASESGNSIYYLKGGDFYRCNGSISFKPYRAYITGPAEASGVKSFGFGDDMEDAINEIMPAENEGIHLYDLNGRKVGKVRSGEIYIMNGRKVMFNR